MNHPKPNLPHGWIVKQSKTYPDRVYYFNVHTGSSTWEVPALLKSFIKQRKSKTNNLEPPVHQSTPKVPGSSSTGTINSHEASTAPMYHGGEIVARFSPEAKFSPELEGSDGSATPVYQDPNDSDDDLDLESAPLLPQSNQQYPVHSQFPSHTLLPLQHSSHLQDNNSYSQLPSHVGQQPGNVHFPSDFSGSYGAGNHFPTGYTPVSTNPTPVQHPNFSINPMYHQSYPPSIPGQPNSQEMLSPHNAFNMYPPQPSIQPSGYQSYNPPSTLGSSSSQSLYKPMYDDKLSGSIPMSMSSLSGWNKEKGGKKSVSFHGKDNATKSKTDVTLVDESSTQTTQTTSTIRNFLGPKKVLKKSTPAPSNSNKIKITDKKYSSSSSCSKVVNPNEEKKNQLSDKKKEAIAKVEARLAKRKVEEAKDEKELKPLEKRRKVAQEKRAYVSSTAGSAGSDTDTRRVVHRQISEESLDMTDLPHFQDPEKIRHIQSWIDQWEPNDPQLDSFSDAGGELSSSTNRTSPDSITLSVSCYSDNDSRKIVVNNYPNKTEDSGISSIGEHSGHVLNNPWKDVHSYPPPVHHVRHVEESMEVEDIHVVENREIEDMDVTDIVLKEVRQHVLKNPEEVTGILTELVKAKTPEDSYQSLVIVIDTCVLISDLGFVQDLRDQDIQGFGKPTILLPWVVMQELDSLKDSKSHVNLSLTTTKKARDAVHFLNDNFTEKHPRVVGQTPIQAKEAAEIFRSEMNDDRILQCCVQCQKQRSNSQIVLLSNDRNLCSKAHIMGISAFCRMGFLSGMQKLKKTSQDTVDKTKGNEKQTEKSLTSPTNTLQEYNKEAMLDDIYCKVKSLLKESLEGMLEREMERAYKDIWLEIVLRKPPWSLRDLIECIRKHWIAVFGDILKRRHHSNIERLWQAFRFSKGFAVTVDSLKELLSDAMPILESYHNLEKNDKVVSQSLKTMRKLQTLILDIQKGNVQVKKLEDYLESKSTQKVEAEVDDIQNESSSKMAERAHIKLRDICTCVESFINSVHEFLKTYNRARDLAQLQQVYMLYEKIVPAVTDLRYIYSRTMEYSPEQVRKQAANVHELWIQVNGFFSRCNIQGNDTQVTSEEMQALFSAANQREVLKKVLPLLDKNICKLHEILVALPDR